MINESREKIIISMEDLTLLKESAEIGRARMFAAGLRGKSYQEKRYEFAKEWAGGNHWNTRSTREWARNILIELKILRESAAARAEAGGFLPGASSSEK